LEERPLPVDLVQLDIQVWDVIQGMDWLTRHKVTMDCERKLVTFSASDGERVTFKGNGHQLTIPTVSAMQAFKMLKKGCQGYLCAIEVTELKELDLSEISVVREFPQVFQEVPRLPPDREIEFTIELVPGTAPISKAPYRMAPAELTELKTQLQELWLERVQFLGHIVTKDGISVDPAKVEAIVNWPRPINVSDM